MASSCDAEIFILTATIAQSLCIAASVFVIGRGLLCFQCIHHRKDIFVAAPAHVQEKDFILRHLFCLIDGAGEGVRWLQRRDNAFELGAELKGGEGVLVGCRQLGDASGLMEPRMFGANARIIEPCRN